MKTLKELLQQSIYLDLRETRNEPGLSIREVAEIIKKAWTVKEIRSLGLELATQNTDKIIEEFKKKEINNSINLLKK